MDKQIADVFDLVAAVIVACICMATGVVTSVRDFNEVKNYEANYEDKTANVKYSPQIKIYGEYDGSLTQQEAILVSQIQDYTAMNIDTIRFAGKNYDKNMTDEANTGLFYDEHITSSYKEGSNTIAAGVWGVMDHSNSEDSLKNKYAYVYDQINNRYVIQEEK